MTRLLAKGGNYGIVVALVVLFVVLALTSDVFLTSRNIHNILYQWSAEGIIAMGLTVLIVSGEFDLSVGALFAVASVVTAKVGMSAAPGVALAAACMCGVAVGLMNGLMVTVLRINSFIATLAMSIALGGLAVILSDQQILTVTRPGFGSLATSEFLGLKLTVWFFFVALALISVFLHRGVFGRKVFAVGGNAEAARLAGVQVSFVRLQCFVLVGVATGLAAFLTTSAVSTAQAESGGFTLLFTVFTAIVVGGTSIAGGVGAIWRTVVGLALLALVGNGFTLLAIDSSYQALIYAGLIVAAVSLDIWGKPRTT